MVLTVTQPHRQWFAWVASLLLHLALFGAVASWSLAPETPERRSSLDVILVTQPSVAPQAAETVAEANQRASGDTTDETSAERAARLETSEVTAPPEAAEQVAKVEPPAAESAQPVPDEAPSALESREESPSPPTTQGNGATSAASSMRGRDLLAQATSSVREQGFDASRAGGLEGGADSAARQAAEARYIDDWTRRVEDYGNRFHPAPSHLDGQLRIRVVIGRKGQLLQAEVVQSSGHTELDQAALNTVHGAAPYRPFDRGMAGVDSLTITRVWRFGKGNNFGVQ
ncbi:hypothetical protein GCM10007160_09150 [Litchfieldella qijiaojingensis]|uniref:TonB C-terminal domain-containing protein n=1 Tax=Litchfieldella qijiaojingensis TaxID=980347 RepID=A0ABQ2YH95_9GAMM|nr:energy transducer TonB [Halomonas qijiaojingensis]GGX84078.1 hypothetical protein GCM10007160_09150 [Halomonas qijiaojingensis]